MATYTVEPVMAWGHVTPGQWRLMKDGNLTGIYSGDWPRLEEMCALLNLAPQELKDRAKAEAYRRTVLGVAA